MRVPDGEECVDLRDGSTAVIRDARRSDEADLCRFFSALGAEARHLRFFTAAVAIAPVARWAAVHPPGAVSLVAVQDGRIVAHGSAVPVDAGEAEVAFAVADDRHGAGLGTLLLRRLAARMSDKGIHVLRADVLSANREMFEVLRHAAPARIERDSDCVHVRLDVDGVLRPPALVSV